MSAIDYSGKKIVVTGGFSGIGAALVSLLKDNGATDITVLDIKQADGSRDKFIETNLGDPASVDAAAAAIGSGVDILFNNAGISGVNPPLQVIQVNTLGLKRLTERVLQGMNTGGTVVNTASTAGSQWPDRYEAIMELLAIDDWNKASDWISSHAEIVTDGYFFSKECVQVYTMLISRKAMQAGIRVNSVCPSPVETALLPEFRKTISDEIIDWAINDGAGRVAQPEDMAKVLLFLGSDLSAYMSGVNLVVDGGFNAAMRTGQVTMPGS
jgi:NAD(P)-dependent dehydrogenase (short-subunit alcohol dehydrogenase family)